MTRGAVGSCHRRVLRRTLQTHPETSTGKKSEARHRIHPILCSLQILGLAYLFFEYGWPLNAWTWSCLAICGSVLMLVCLARPTRFFFLRHIVTLPFLLSLIVPLESNWIQDVHGGRTGAVISPWALRFGRDGENTELLESYLGELKPKWRHQSIRSMAFERWSDGDERVNSRSLIYSKRLEKILFRLPNRAARRQVLDCLTDSSNLLRVHQGLLLAALDAKGYPDGHDSATWWEAHSWVFVVEKSGLRAAYITHGWTDRCSSYLDRDGNEQNAARFELLASQVRAANYQFGGSWGGDRAFGEGAGYLLALKLDNLEIDQFPLTYLNEEFEGKTVVWWR
ncbi:MAG: hypothetical protein P1V97_25890 [Planctomycetota bacterium]|nr:hypothetical protein [Planctomycetota bacterium]